VENADVGDWRVHEGRGRAHFEPLRVRSGHQKGSTPLDELSPGKIIDLGGRADSEVRMIMRRARLRTSQWKR
jgi:hypothetical protein